MRAKKIKVDKKYLKRAILKCYIYNPEYFFEYGKSLCPKFRSRRNIDTLKKKCINKSCVECKEMRKKFDRVEKLVTRIVNALETVDTISYLMGLMKFWIQSNRNKKYKDTMFRETLKDIARDLISYCQVISLNR